MEGGGLTCYKDACWSIICQMKMSKITKDRIGGSTTEISDGCLQNTCTSLKFKLI